MSSSSKAPPDINTESACNLLNKLTKHAQDLLAVLIYENSALRNRKHGDLHQASKQKDMQLSAIESQIEQSAWIIDHLQAEIRKQEHPRYSRAQPPELVALWEELCAILHRCYYQNNVNGELIKALRCHIRGIINVIQRARAENDVYDGSGRRYPTNLSHYSNIA